MNWTFDPWAHQLHFWDVSLHLCCMTGTHCVTCLSLRTGSVTDDGELSTVCYRPEGIDRLVQQTNFNRKELQVLYRGFKSVSQHFLSTITDSCVTISIDEIHEHCCELIGLCYMWMFSWSWHDGAVICTGVSQWCGEWGDVQKHLLPVLPSGRSVTHSLPFFSRQFSSWC